jgi:hypothetical protein
MMINYINRTLVFDYKYVKFYFLLNKVYVIAIKNFFNLSLNT